MIVLMMLQLVVMVMQRWESIDMKLETATHMARCIKLAARHAATKSTGLSLGRCNENIHSRHMDKNASFAGHHLLPLLRALCHEWTQHHRVVALTPWRVSRRRAPL